MTRRPHQHSEVVAVPSIHVNAVIEKDTNHGGKSAACGIDDGGLVRVVHRLGIGALLDQKLDDGNAAHIGGCRERGDAVASGQTSLPGRNGITPLSAAAYMGSVPIVELLIEKGADPKTMDNTNKAAIVYAAGRGFPSVVRVFLDHGVDVNARYGHDLTVLMWAAGHSEEAGVNDVAEEMTLFLDRGAHIDDQDDRGRTALRWEAHTS